MTKQVIDVRGYWKVIVYYNFDCHFFSNVALDLFSAGSSTASVRRIYDMLKTKRAKAVTLSSLDKKVSVVIFSTHNDSIDYVNSIAHEAEHVKQAMLDVYGVEDMGEPPAYTIGYLMGRMYDTAIRFL